MALLVLLDSGPKLLVDRLDQLQAALLPQGLGEGSLKGLLLLCRRHGRLSAEDGVDKLLVELLRLPGVEEGVVDVRSAVVESGKQEAQLRLGDDLPRRAAVELVLPGEIAQGGLTVLHRADAADKVGKDLVTGVGLVLVVLATVGHVVDVVAQEDEVVAPLQVQGVDDLVIKGLTQSAVGQAGVPQAHEEPVLLAVGHLPGGEDDIDEVLSQSAGEGFLQQPQIFFRLLLGHGPQRAVNIGDDLPASVHIAAVHPADGAPVGAEPPAQFIEFLLVHGLYLAFPVYAPTGHAGRTRSFYCTVFRFEMQSYLV